MRDALSLLDQAIADGGKDAASVRGMLGLADRARVLDLFEMIVKGDAKAALEELRDQHRSGAEPEATMRDLAETTHWLSTLKISPDLVDDPSLSPDARTRGGALAESLGMRVLARNWQMLLKALDELARTPSPIMAAEMAVIRLCAVADLPSPEELVRKLSAEGANAPAAPPRPDPAPSPQPQARLTSVTSAQPQQVVIEETHAAPAPETAALPLNFDALIEYIREKKDALLLTDVKRGVRLVSYAPGRIDYQPSADAPEDLAGRLIQSLTRWTGQRWIVTVSDEPGADTYDEIHQREIRSLEERVRQNPLVKAGLDAFPDAEIRVIPRMRRTGNEDVAAPDELGDDDDLFGED